MIRRVLPIVPILACLWLAPGASAATTIGQVFTPTAQTSATLGQTSISSGVGYTVPSNGVITSWSFQADADGATLRLKALRANSDGTYTVVGESGPVTATGSQQQSFPTRVPVQAGDIIGTSASSGKTVAYTGANDDDVVLAPDDQPAGSSGPYSNVQGIRVDVTASIEADADGDGFGDETQDQCPTDPGLQTKCLANLQLGVSTDKHSVHPGDQVSFAVKAHNAGPAIARNVQLDAGLSPEMKLVGTSGGTCSGAGESLICSVGDVASGADATLTIVAQALTTGIGTVAARGISDTADPNSADNAAGGSLSVVWHAGRCANVFTGKPGRDVIKGTRAGDRIDGLDGNDILAGLTGADCIDGGPGDDHITGGDGADVLDGGPGNDVLSGDAGNDKIDGGAGNDRIAGGSGADQLKGGAGNDSIDAVDGHRDTVDCGSGRRDVARVDSVDRVVHCERVVRSKRSSK